MARNSDPPNTRARGGFEPLPPGEGVHGDDVPLDLDPTRHPTGGVYSGMTKRLANTDGMFADVGGMNARVVVEQGDKIRHDYKPLIDRSEESEHVEQKRRRD